MKYIYTSIFILLLIFEKSTFAQQGQTIRGSVVEKDTKQPISGVSIKILSNDSV